MTAPVKGPTPEHYEAALAAIDEEELVDLSLELAQIDSPPGQEQPVSDRVLEWLEDNGFEASQVGMFADRANVVGRLRGSGGGNTVIFNAPHGCGLGSRGAALDARSRQPHLLLRLAGG